MYNINLNIPGWNQEQILTIISDYSSKVPKNGNILELGALFGRTTYAIGHNKPESVILHSIDIWGTLEMKYFTETYFHDKLCSHESAELINSKIKTNPDRLDGLDFFALWKYWTQGIPNLIPYRSLTTLPNKDFPMFDIIIHDAGHSFEEVYTDLVHWFPKLLPDGVIIIDDYERIQFPGVVVAVDRFVRENKLKTEMVTNRNILLRR